MPADPVGGPVDGRGQVSGSGLRAGQKRPVELLVLRADTERLQHRSRSIAVHDQGSECTWPPTWFANWFPFDASQLVDQVIAPRSDGHGELGL